MSFLNRFRDRRPVKALFDFVVRHPVWVLIAFLAATAALGWQARHFEIDASADTLLTEDNRHYVRTQVVSRRFGSEEFLLIAYQPEGRELLSEKTFRDVREIGERIEQLDRVESVRSLMNVPIFVTDGDGALSAGADPSKQTLEHREYSMEQLQTALDNHPIYENLLVNEDMTATAIQVLFESDPRLEELYDRIVDLQRKSLDEELSKQERETLAQLRQQAKPIEDRIDETRLEEIQAVRDILAEYEDGANLYLGGVHVLGHQLIQIIRNDLAVFGAAIAVMIGLILFVLFRGARWVLIPAVCCACSVLATMGLFGLLGFKATVISSSFVALQLILTLALVMHLIVQYREYAARDPDKGHGDLVRATMLEKAGPVFYAGLTTSIGFGALLFSGLQPVISFGWMMIIAMFFAIGTSLILFPAMMAMFPKERSTPAPHASARWVLTGLASLSLRRPGVIGAVTAGAAAICAGGLFLLDVENSFIDYFRDSTQVHQELSYIDREFGGTTPLDIVYTIPEENQQVDLVLTAETVQTLQRVEEALQQYEAVGKILSVTNFTALGKQLNNGDPLTEYELTAVYWSLDESIRASLLDAYFSPIHQQVRFSVRIQDSTEGLDRAELLADIRNDLERIGISEDQYSMSNLFVLYQDILQQLFRSQILTLVLVYGVLVLTLYAVFRSFKVGCIAIAPTVLATLAVLGIMGWLRIPLDLMTITIAAIATGIAIDNAIHYVHRYLEELESEPGDRAVERSHDSVGYAILYTSVIIILGFSLLAFSDFVPSILFGLLTGLAMALSVVLNLTVLPVLLRRYVISDS